MSGISQHITHVGRHTNLAISTYSTLWHLSILQVLGLLVGLWAYAVRPPLEPSSSRESCAKLIVVPGGKWPVEYV